MRDIPKIEYLGYHEYFVILNEWAKEAEQELYQTHNDVKTKVEAIGRLLSEIRELQEIRDANSSLPSDSCLE